MWKTTYQALSGRPHTPKDCSLQINFSCQTRPNALDMSKNIPLTSSEGPQSMSSFTVTP